ncbi:concanavalin A-like lectin/glucanase domain-containing protein [Plectosphaerella plurivora]|uniref:Concanavalin A-like lectin/glucanase domain-containing protein n=1 Tax=Plectosphaerella plurivora TaxID=936078 RepID=A0A9P9ADI4_9PEZI|nr:concanavalin A-like lectin/glucanase domain-containing protein [Plectosphaerella plurivora]
MKTFIPLALLAALAVGAPHPSVESSIAKRATVCGTDDTIHTTLFNVHNFFLGTLGSQCLTVLGQFDTSLSWSATWSWDGDAASRKSFPAGQLRKTRFIPVSSIASIPTEWLWSYTVSDDVVANVAYDIQGSSVCGSLMDWNVQVWLGTYGGLTPPGDLVASPTITGVAYDAYNSFSDGKRKLVFVASTTQQSFNGDLGQFLQWAVDNTNAEDSWCVYSVQAGTEAYKGTQATFRSQSLKLGQNLVPGTPVPTTTVTAPAPTATGWCPPVWGQCGGHGYTGPQCCQAGSFCAFWNDWESQCFPVNG